MIISKGDDDELKHKLVTLNGNQEIVKLLNKGNCLFRHDGHSYLALAKRLESIRRDR
jgi:hypothetical protein